MWYLWDLRYLRYLFEERAGPVGPVRHVVLWNPREVRHLWDLWDLCALWDMRDLWQLWVLRDL